MEKNIKIKPEELFIHKYVNEWYDIQKLIAQLNRPFQIILEEKGNGKKQAKIHKQK